MESVLAEVGLSEKEIKLYLFLLERKPLPAVSIAKGIEESRTNTYMLLDALSKLELVISDDNLAVRHFGIAPPQNLRNIVVEKQQSIKQADAGLRSIMPELSSKYRLSQHKPGVIYREGIDGLRDVLEDMVRAEQEILLIPSDVADEHTEAFEMLLKATVKRKASNIPTRAILHKRGRNWPVMKSWPKQGIATRFIGEDPYDGEVIIYGDNCIFITYVPELITTVITNKTIAKTMKQLFEQLWAVAED